VSRKSSPTLEPTPPPDPEPSPRWRRRPEDRPDEIIDAAIVVFGKQGFAAAKLEDIARRAGVSKGTLYLYFDSKDALFRAMVRSRISAALPSVDELLPSGSTVAEATERFIRRLWQFISRPDVVPIVRLVHSEIAESFPDLARFYFNEVIVPSRRLLVSVLQRGMVSGEFHTEHPELIQREICSLVVHGAMCQRYFARHDPEPVADARLIDGIVDLALRGLGAPPRPRKRSQP